MKVSGDDYTITAKKDAALTPAAVRGGVNKKYSIIRVKVTATGSVSSEGDKVSIEVPGSKLSLPVVASAGDDKKQKEKSAKALADLKKAKKGDVVTISGEASEDGSVALDSFSKAKK